jgi:hypothetical protein
MGPALQRTAPHRTMLRIAGSAALCPGHDSVRNLQMRFAAIADVHGNYLALEAVLADIRALGANALATGWIE